MSCLYRHTQTGYTSIAFIGFGFIIIAWGFIRYGENPFALIALGLLLLVFALLFSLTITIDNEYLRFSLGIGIIKKKFPLQSIRSFEIVRNAWYYGWGIRLTPYGWLYNVSGFTALQITMESGRKYRIGTDNPEDLLKALKLAKESISYRNSS